MKLINTIIYHIVAALAMAGVLTACSDDYFAGEGLDPAGEADVALDLAFTDYGTGASRAAAGNTIGGIDDVCILVYSTDGSLFMRRHVRSGEGLEVDGNRGTARLTLPYGRYRIYTVANMGDLQQYGSAVESEEVFRNLRFDWSGDIAANRQMCGFVTDSADTPVANRRSPVVTIGKTTGTLHSWLRRAVSKVTISYDASELNQNVFIYICSAQIKDIPRSCTMAAANVPQLVANAKGEEPTPAEALTDGETIDYMAKTADYRSSRVVLASGSAYGGLQSEDQLLPGQNVHREDEESLFFFENMQGEHERKHQYQNFESKDSVPYGTYIEVKAYYENKGTNPSRGEIVYRYMLGMDDEKSFDSPRNTHFRVRLRFVGDANSPDWHVGYNLPGPPTIELPSPLYISYLYNQQLDVPITAYYDPTQHEIVKMDARIDANPYTYAGHEYGTGCAGTSVISGTTFTYDYTGREYGFLSFGRQASTSTIVTDKSNYVESVHYTTFPTSQHDGTKLSWTFPIYTRPLNLLVRRSNGAVVPHGFSGNNHFTHRERVGNIKVTVVFRSLVNGITKEVTQDVEIRQAKRVVNPKGCWRPYNSTAPFTFTLMESDDDACNISPDPTYSVGYAPIRSNGPWSARIYSYSYNGQTLQPGADWIQLSPKGRNAWRGGSNAEVTGATNSVVEFDYRPAGTTSASKPRFGVIEVTYHNHNCHHLIFVSQGFGSVEMGASRTKWMMGNLYANGTEVPNPVMEGSMFKYGNASYALLSTNNYTMQNPAGAVAGAYREAYDTDLQWLHKTYDTASGKYTEKQVTSKYGPVAADVQNGFTNEGLKHDGTGGTYRIATYADYSELLDPERFGTLFGVLYGAEMSGTATKDVDRYTLEGDASGMRGCFVFDRATGNHLFLPIGNTGFGRRKIFYNNNTGFAVLKYANRDAFMDNSLARFMPMQYDIYRKPGALYWFGQVVKDGGAYKYALDINYFTYAMTTMDAQIAWWFGGTLAGFKGTAPSKGTWAKQNSDAAFVRRIRTN